jgi:hypothetical protein
MTDLDKFKLKKNLPGHGIFLMSRHYINVMQENTPAKVNSPLLLKVFFVEIQEVLKLTFILNNYSVY